MRTLLNRLSKVLPTYTLINIYKTFILPVFDYADTIWTTCNLYLQQRVERLQTRATRIIVGGFDYINSRCFDLLNTLKWPTSKEWQDYRTNVLLFKCIHWLVPANFCDNDVMFCDSHEYGTHQANSMNLYLTKPKQTIPVSGIYSIMMQNCRIPFHQFYMNVLVWILIKMFY